MNLRIVRITSVFSWKFSEQTIPDIDVPARTWRWRELADLPRSMDDDVAHF
jgi:hypothetical protein